VDFIFQELVYLKSFHVRSRGSSPEEPRLLKW
jgi:hypothetical protein